MAFGVFQLLAASVLILSICHAQEWAGSVKYNGKCLRYMDELKSWDDALTSCVNMGGTLATVTSWGEWDDIKYYLRIGVVTVWIGADKKSNGVTFVWTDSNSPATELSGMWATGYPNTTYGYDCVYMEAEAFNADCSSTHRYICMEPNSGTTKCTVPTTTTAATTTNMITSTAYTTLSKTTVTTSVDTTEKTTASPTTARTTALSTTATPVTGTTTASPVAGTTTATPVTGTTTASSVAGTTTASPITVTTKLQIKSRKPKNPCKKRSKSRRN